MPGHRPGGATGLRGTQRMVSGVDSQAEVGQEDQEETQEYECCGLPDARVAHLSSIVCLQPEQKQETS